MEKESAGNYFTERYKYKEVSHLQWLTSLYSNNGFYPIATNSISKIKSFPAKG